MKKYVLILFLLVAEVAMAQDFIQKRVFFYRTLAILNKDYEPTEVGEMGDEDAAIVFSEMGDMDFVTILIGDNTLTGQITIHKKGNIQKDNTRTDVYGFAAEKDGIKLPMQLFEIYDVTKSSVVPSSFFLSCHNRSTGEYAYGFGFEGITRTK